MTEHVETDESGAAVPARTAGAKQLVLAPVALAGLIFASGYAYDHREQYGAAYQEMFGASSGCAAKANFAGGCCRQSLAGGGCSGEVGQAIAWDDREPVKAPKPPADFASTVRTPIEAPRATL